MVGYEVIVWGSLVCFALLVIGGIVGFAALIKYLIRG